MGLKKSKGNMYPWVTHTHSHIGGECPHKCIYCYVNNPRFGRPGKYCGPIRLIEDELLVKYENGKTIFVENCNDLFAADIPQEFLNKILAHCIEWPDNTYVWQTKNPARYLTLDALFPRRSILGATIETNRDTTAIGKAPAPQLRYEAMKELKGYRKFVTIEPVLKFDLEVLSRWIIDISPEFVNIGADSKVHNLPEPTNNEVEQLISIIRSYGIEVREKHNLNRLRK